jgi:hypothetical protein
MSRMLVVFGIALITAGLSRCIPEPRGMNRLRQP